MLLRWKMIGLAAAASLLLTTTSPAPAGDTSAASAKKRDPNRLICRSDPAPGSRLTKSQTCLTAAQWEQKQREAKEFTEGMQNARSPKDESDIPR